MADNIIDSLKIKIELDNKQLKESTKQTQDTIDNLGKGISGTFKTAFQAIGVGFGLDLGKKLIQNFVGVGNNLQNVAQNTQESTKAIQQWQQAFIRVGSSAEAASAQIKTIYDRFALAKWQGDPKLLGGLQTILGINPYETNGELKKTSDLMKEMAVQLNKQPVGNRAGIAKQLGLDDNFLRVVNDFGGDLDGLFTKLDKIGYVTEKQTQDAVKLNRAWADLSQVWTTASATLIDRLTPALMGVAKILANSLNKFKSDIDPNKGVLFKHTSHLQEYEDYQKGGGKGNFFSGDFKKYQNAVENQVTVPIPQIESGVNGNIINNPTPTAMERGQGLLESTNRPGLNTGNGAYGEYQVRPTYFKNALKLIHHPLASKTKEEITEWLKDPKHDLEANRIMMRSDVNGSEDLERRYRVYSHGQYGLKEVQAAAAKVSHASNNSKNMTIGQVHIHGVQDTGAFTQDQWNKADVGWGISGSMLA